MNTIIKILMKRDGYSKAEAKEMYDDTMNEVYEAIACGDNDLAEEIFTSNLGLEPDYLINVLI